MKNSFIKTHETDIMSWIHDIPDMTLTLYASQLKTLICNDDFFDSIFWNDSKYILELLHDECVLRLSDISDSKQDTSCLLDVPSECLPEYLR